MHTLRLAFLAVVLLAAAAPTANAGTDPGSIRELIKRLDDSNFEVVESAAAALVKLGDRAVPPLIEKMKQNALAGTWGLIPAVLGRIGSASVGPLTRELDNHDLRVRMRALAGLMEVGPPARSAVPAMAKLLKDSSQYVRMDAALALGELGDARAIRPLVDRLREEKDRGARDSIVTAIGKFGPKAAEAVPVLIEIVTEPVGNDTGFGSDISNPRNHAAVVLAGIGAVSVKPLADVLGNPKHSRGVRYSAGVGLDRLGGRSAPEVPRLILLIDDPDPVIREMAIFVLGGIGPKAADAVPRLLKVLNEPSASLRIESASALHSIDRKQKRVVPALIKCLQDGEAMNRVGAALALGNLGAEAHVAIPALVKLLKDRDERVRRAVAESLASIGPKASRAIPALRKLLADEDEGVRESAAHGIEVISGAKKDR